MSIRGIATLGLSFGIIAATAIVVWWGVFSPEATACRGRGGQFWLDGSCGTFVFKPQ